MQWMITQDLINTPPNRHLSLTREMIAQFRAASKEERVLLRVEIAKTMTHEFQLLDDDGELYYVGLCNEEDFAPLDWASADVGATTMMTRKIGDTKWEHL